MSIRPCRTEDLPFLRAICEETASIPCGTDAERAFLHLMFCDPYAQTQTPHCFVAVNDLDEPVGYILCAPDTRAFLQTFWRTYLPRIDRLGLRFAVQARGAQLWHALTCGTFPAHMHIDLSEQGRHSGTGSALLCTLKAHLASQGVHTLILSCAKKNENAVRFYKRNGFVTSASLFGANIMVCHF